MCGRFALQYDTSVFSRFGLSNGMAFPSHYNIAPSQNIPVISEENLDRFTPMQWGLIPFWEEKKTSPLRLVNIRDDTLKKKSWAQRYLTSTRCIIPASGFYEWQKTPDGKQPYYFYPAGKGYLGFAGIYTEIQLPHVSESMHTVAILTTAANDLMRPVHLRMPAILGPHEEALWLDPDRTEPDTLIPLLHPSPNSLLDMHPVSVRVNNPAVDSVDLIAERR